MSNQNQKKPKKPSKPKFNYIDKYMYQSKDILGEGAFGKVFKGYYATKEGQTNDSPLAIKIQTMPKDLDEIEKRENLNSIRHDIVTLKLLDHPNIVRLLDVKKKDQDIFMIMEYCDDKDLTAFMKGKDFSELQIRYYFAQILQAFKHIHMQNLMHRDVKPQNIMVNNGVMKVGDFGFAKKFGESKSVQYKTYHHHHLHVIKGTNYYESTVSMELPESQENDDQKFLLIQQVTEYNDESLDYRLQIARKHPDHKMILGVCDLKSILRQNEIDKANNKDEFVFNAQNEYKGFYALDSEGYRWSSARSGELVSTQACFELDQNHCIQCRVNLKDNLIIMYVQNETKEEENIHIQFNNVFTYPEFQKEDLVVFAIFQSKDEEANITMTNGPKLYESFKGTLLTVAPQVIEGAYGDKCDIYSLGCTLFWMIYKEFRFQNITNQFRLNNEQKKNDITFPEKPKISEELKQAIKQMLQYKEEDRIDWEDLFKLPVFNMKSLLEDPYLNEINVTDYDKLSTKVLDYDEIKKQVDEEFEIFIPKEYEEDYNEKQEQEALNYVNQVEKRIQSQNINKKVVAALKFEKGKAQVVRMVTKSIKDFQASGRVVFGEQRVLIQDLLDLIKFGLTKYELLMMKRIIETLNDTQNGYKLLQIEEEEWKIFQEEKENKESILNAMEKDTRLFETLIYGKQKHEASKFIDLVSVQDINYQSNVVNNNTSVNIKELLTNKFNINDQQEFFVTLYNLIIQLIRFLKKPIQGYVHQENNNNNAFQRQKDVVEVIDNLLILLSMEKIFIWDPKNPINFSTFFENKKLANVNQEEFQVTFVRVQKALDVFFQGQY